MARCRSFETSASARVSPTGAVTIVTSTGQVECRVTGTADERRKRRELHYRLLEKQAKRH